MLDAGVFGIEDEGKVIAGLIGTALFAAYGCGQIISGFLGDKLSPKLMILIGLSTSAVCNGMMPLLTNPLLMIPVWAVNGLAQACMWPPLVAILTARLNRQEYSRACVWVSQGSAFVCQGSHLNRRAEPRVYPY